MFNTNQKAKIALRELYTNTDKATYIRLYFSCSLQIDRAGTQSDVRQYIMYIMPFNILSPTH